jgi:hypothetical protein
VAETKQLSKTAKKSMMNEKKNVPLKAIAWAWERGIKVGQGRKPDYYLYTQADLVLFPDSDWIVIKANSGWIGGVPARK